jgi:hypothetical protein
MAIPRHAILELAAVTIQQRRRRATPASPVVLCRICGERLRCAVELIAGRHAGCRSRPLEYTGG